MTIAMGIGLGFNSAARNTAEVFPPIPSFMSTNLAGWWNADHKEVDTNVYNTISCLYDLSGNNRDFIQPTKVLQPISNTDGAYFFGLQRLSAIFTTDFAKNWSSYYMAVVVKPYAEAVSDVRTVLQVSKNSGTTSNRASLKLASDSVTASRRKIRHYGSINDGTEKNVLSTYQATDITFNVLEMQIDLANDVIDYWVNNQNSQHTAVYGATGTIANNNPLTMNIGNIESGSQPLVGAIKEIIVLSQKPSESQRTSIYNYLNGRIA